MVSNSKPLPSTLRNSIGTPFRTHTLTGSSPASNSRSISSRLTGRSPATRAPAMRASYRTSASIRSTSPPRVIASATACTVNTLPNSNCGFNMISGRGRHCSRSSSSATTSDRKPSASTISSTPAALSRRKCRSIKLMPPNRSRHFGKCSSSSCCKRIPRPAARMMARMKTLSYFPINDIAARTRPRGITDRFLGFAAPAQMQEYSPPFDPLPRRERRQAEQYFAHPLGERQSECDIRTQAQQQSHADQPGFLYAESGRYHEEHALGRLRQALEHQRIGEAHGMPEPAQREPCLRATGDEPGNLPNQGPRQSVARGKDFPDGRIHPGTVIELTVVVEPWTEQPHRLLFDSMKDAAIAHDDDHGDQRRQRGSEADCNERVLREEREQKLDDDARAGRGAVHSLLHQEPQADDLAADIGDGKQTIDGLPDTGD